jgi:aminoglycoside phosphotransferase (APT) family kinase protein
MHADEVETHPALVRRLIAGRFPRWAGLPVQPVLPRGTDNSNYRLGHDKVVRLPRREVNVGSLERELEWLPVFASSSPVSIPEPLGRGEPAEGFPFPWAVFRWVKGETVSVDEISDPWATAARLAEFVLALRRLDAATAPPGLRRGPLRRFDGATREAVAKLARRYDAEALMQIWDEAIAAPEWDGPPTWCHCDLDLRNLVFADGSLSGVLDFGGVGAGDPASDATVARKALPSAARDAFLSAIGADETTVARARGWTVFQGAMALSYYTLHSNAPLYLEAERWLGEILAG